MSRIGNKPVVIPQGVKVQVVDRGVSAEGPKGKLVQPLPPGLSAKVEDSRVIISRAGEDRKVRALHGLARSLVQNMVAGVKEPFERKLEIVGIGYRAQVQGRAIQLALGYSHPVIFPLPDGITAEIDKQTLITLRGAAKAVGELLAQQAKARGIDRVVFDRGGYRYHGRVKALADAARAGGLGF